MNALIVLGAFLVGIPLLTKLDPDGAQGKARSHDPILIGCGLVLTAVGAVAHLF